MRIWSYTRPVIKPANAPAKGIFPLTAKPAEMPIILASAMPVWMKRSGWAFLKSPIFKLPVTSAHKAKIRGSFSPASNKPAPNPERVSLKSLQFIAFIFRIFSLKKTFAKLRKKIVLWKCFFSSYP